MPLRAYAIAIIAGIALAIWIADRRWRARGGRPGTVADIAVWAVIFGLVGGRLYHVLTDPELYFGEGRHPVDAVKIWEGGLGIWGAIALGAVGVWIAARRRGIRFGAFADAAAPGIAVAQGVGRLGNWFNNELFGHATTRPWGLTVYNIDPATHRAVQFNGKPEVRGHFQPTFLYELVWDLGVAGLVVWADRRFKLGRGRAFALYAMAYTAGRVWIEALRADPANHLLGVRLNIWTSAVVFLAALLLFVLRRGPREEFVEISGIDDPEDGGEPAPTGEALADAERDGSTEVGNGKLADAPGNGHATGAPGNGHPVEGAHTSRARGGDGPASGGGPESTDRSAERERAVSSADAVARDVSSAGVDDA